MTGGRNARPPRRFAWPVPDLWRGSSLSDEDVSGYGQFRLAFMDLKPRVDPAEDDARFSSWVKSADFVWLERDQDGKPLGATSVKIESRMHEGRECVIIQTQYVYISPAIRKSAGAATAVLVALCLAVLRYPGRPVYLVGPGYLPSFLALAQVFERTWLRADSRMSAWEQSLWHALAGETHGYDDATQLIDMDTFPREPRQDPPRDPSVLARYQEYLEHNPRWAEGYGCLVCVRIGRPDIVRGLRMLAQRMRHRS